MRKFFVLFFVFITAISLAQNVSYDSIQINNQMLLSDNDYTLHYYQNYSITNSIKDTVDLEALFNYSGSMIYSGSRLKNRSLMIGMIGSAVGGVILGVGTGVGVGTGNTDVTITTAAIGGVITGGSLIAACILDIIGNNRIKKGGFALKNVKIKGSGISISF